MKRVGLFIVSVCLVLLCLSGCKADGETSGSTKPVVTVSSTGVTENNPQTEQPHSASGSTANQPATVQTTQKQQVRVTIPEGWSFMQVAQALERAGVCTSAAFYDTCQNYTVKSFHIPSSSDRCFKMEGYLYPDTYDFYQDDDPEDVLRKILNNYAAKSGMPSDETLILASVIEREVRSQGHMKMVSSVLHNRLDKGMKLECDSTRDYVNEYITGNNLVADQSKYAPLYNTYKCAALPAGPICNPSATAIAAAKNYADSEYLFFFFGQDNDNHYSVTYEEHLQQISQYGIG